MMRETRARPGSPADDALIEKCINAEASMPARSEVVRRLAADPLDFAEGAGEMLAQVPLRQFRPAGNDRLGHRGMVGDDLLRLARARQMQPAQPVEMAAAAADELAQARHAGRGVEEAVEG